MSTTSCMKDVFIKQNYSDGDDYYPVYDGVSNALTIGQISVELTKLIAKNWAKRALPTGQVADFVSDLVAANGPANAVSNFMHKVMHREEITRSDIGNIFKSFVDAGMHIVNIFGTKTPWGLAVSLGYSAIQILKPYVPCLWEDGEPSKDDAEKVKSPLAIDLDGDGIATYALKNGVFFDIDADGFAEKMAWLNGKDALLAIDRNKNGVIDNATELFGDLTAENGFEALKALDSNGDGIIDANDIAWEQLLLWQDTINDGVSTDNELITAADAGIAYIELNYKNQDVTDENGNQHRQTATVHWQDGHTTVIEDIWFQHNNAQTIDLTELDITDEEWADLAELPYIDAFGDVHSLWVAMSLDATLKAMVQDYVSADTATRANMLDDLIYRWTGSDGVDPYSRDPNKAGYGHVMDARQLVSLEHLVGEDYLGTWCWGERDPNPHGKAAPILIAEYNKFKDYVAAQISAQMDYPEIFAPVFLMQYDEETQSLHGNWSLFNTYIQEQFNQGEVIEIKNLLKIANDLGKYNPQYRQDLADNLEVLSQYETMN
ncbi:MAG: hypothetical protein J6V99_01380 [Neisseriaceae bacterium]|nr:hypothetical protein [Neisseriaceae bacterium]